LLRGEFVPVVNKKSDVRAVFGEQRERPDPMGYGMIVECEHDAGTGQKGGSVLNRGSVRMCRRTGGSGYGYSNTNTHRGVYK
jgi:hypothetical protein